MNSELDKQIDIWLKRSVSSALWAAYGDALGFLSELATRSLLKWRCGDYEVEKTIKWRRRIGGKFGVNVEMPAGCYSDDTQLRLAVGRSINGQGFFDVESFAQIEMPVWLSYCLGAGISSQAAAENLLTKRVAWNANFYKVGKADYLSAGGNGVAMRVQPHVWSLLVERNPESLLRDVVRDCLVSHGHPNAIIGAGFHALSLLKAMEGGTLSPFTEWEKTVSLLAKIPSILNSDQEINLIWFPSRQAKATKTFEVEFHSCLEDFVKNCTDLIKIGSCHSDVIYKKGVVAIGGMDKSTMGSGSATALLASWLAEGMAQQPNPALLWAVNCLGSDTDSIASMAGAILGAVGDQKIPNKLQDSEYIEWEANRLGKVRFGIAESQFKYPEMLTPFANSRMDAFVESSEGDVLLGLGPLKEISNPVYISGKDIGWQWCSLAFGQTVLVKRRRKPISSKATYGIYEKIKLEKMSDLSFQKNTVNKNNITSERQSATLGVSVNQSFDQVLKAEFDPTTIGQIILALSLERDGVDKAIAFAALVSKARNTRAKKVSR